MTDVQAMVENHLKDMILKTFDPKKADTIFTEEGEVSLSVWPIGVRGVCVRACVRMPVQMHAHVCSPQPHMTYSNNLTYPSIFVVGNNKTLWSYKNQSYDQLDTSLAANAWAKLHAIVGL